MVRVVNLFFSIIERILNGVKTNSIRLIYPNVKLGKGSRVFYRSSIWQYSQRGGVVIGDNCLIGRTRRGYHGGMPFCTTILSDGQESFVRIGDNSRINGAYIHSKSQISIGSNCVVASGVTIIDSNGHELYSNDRTTGRDSPRPIVIGNNVWIGMNVIILKGTEIGDNSVVAAGSVVKGHYPNNSLIQGNPAIVMRTIDLQQ